MDNTTNEKTQTIDVLNMQMHERIINFDFELPRYHEASIMLTFTQPFPNFPSGPGIVSHTFQRIKTFSRNYILARFQRIAPRISDATYFAECQPTSVARISHNETKLGIRISLTFASSFDFEELKRALLVSFY